jgi:H+/gluconate symporter-like permease
MDLSTCLVIYVIVVLIITLVMYKTCHTIWASLLYGFVFGLVLLLIIEPPSSIDPYSTGVESTSTLYMLIILLTPIYIAIYSLKIAFYDKRY